MSHVMSYAGCWDHCVLHHRMTSSPTERLEKVPDDVYEGCLHVDVLLAAAALVPVPVGRLLVPAVPVPAAVAVAVLVQAGPHHDVHQDTHLGEFY